MSLFSDPLWVVTSYYNPAGYKRRLQNFKAFRRHLKAPLIVVELAKAGHHQLDKDDGDIVLSLVGEDRIWQKERLLNIGVRELPPHVRYAAWVDCDIVFEDEDWSKAAKNRIDQDGGMLQLFDMSVHLPSHLEVGSLSREDCGRAAPLLTGRSIATSVRLNLFDENEARLVRARAAMNSGTAYPSLDGHNCYGLAWAAHRSLIEDCGHYDRNIIGGADALHAFAALSKLDTYWDMRPHTPAHREHIAVWVGKAAAAGLFSNIGALGQKAFHLWHGSFSHRNYRGRHGILTRNDFDPAGDIEVAENGTWRWTDPHGALAREVGAYFFSRHEDGIA